jgi:hypothetical protein
MVNRLNKWKVDLRLIHLWCYVPLTNNPIRSPQETHVMRCTSAHNWTACFVKVIMNPRKAARRRDCKHQKRAGKRFMARWDERKWYLIWISDMIRSSHPTTLIGWSNLSYPMTIQQQCPVRVVSFDKLANLNSKVLIKKKKSEDSHLSMHLPFRAQRQLVLICARAYSRRAIEQWLTPRNIH